MDVDNAGRPVGFLLFVRKVVRFQVSVVEDDHPPIMDSASGKNIIGLGLNISGIPDSFVYI